MTDAEVRAGYRLHNIKLLTAYAAPPARSRSAVSALRRSCRVCQPPRPSKTLARALCPSDLAVHLGLLHLAYHGVVDLPLDDAPITPTTVVTLRRQRHAGGGRMSQQRFITGACVRWHGATYQITRLLPGGQAHLEDVLTGATTVVEIAILVKALFAAELVFILDHQLAATPGQTQDDSTAPRSLADYPAPLVAIARYRLTRD